MTLKELVDNLSELLPNAADYEVLAEQDHTVVAQKVVRVIKNDTIKRVVLEVAY